jgi:hypothetical protein
VQLFTTAVARLVQCLIVLVLMALTGFNVLVMLSPSAPDTATAELAFLIGLSAVLMVFTIEFATTRIIKAIEAHPQAFAAEIKSQRSESRAMKTPA